MVDPPPASLTCLKNPRGAHAPQSMSSLWSQALPAWEAGGRAWDIHWELGPGKIVLCDPSHAFWPIIPPSRDKELQMKSRKEERI